MKTEKLFSELPLIALAFTALAILTAVAGGCRPAPAAQENPTEVVEQFYRWYIGYPGNPLAEQAYRTSEYLTAEWVQEVDQTIAASDRGAYDPFLCAQDIPPSFTVGEAMPTGEEATVTVYQMWNPDTEYEFTRDLTVTLQLVSGEWKIARVTCPDPGTPPSPATPVGQPTPAAPSPQAYQRVDVPAAGLIVAAPQGWQQLTPQWAWTPSAESSLRLGINWVDIHPPTEPEAALLPGPAQVIDSQPVELSWGSARSFTLEVYAAAEQGSDGPAPVQAVETHVIVVVEAEDRRRAFDFYASGQNSEELAALTPALQYMISTVTLTGTIEGWQIFHDTAYGYQIQYPAGWTFRELTLLDPQLSAPTSIVQIVQFMPQEWADQLAAGGPPDPTAPPLVAPLSLEVTVGTLEEYRRDYAEPARSETIAIGPYTVTREEDSPGDYRVIRYVFQHPADDSLRVTLADQLSGFPARVQGNEEVIALAQQMLATFAFTR